LFSWNEVQFLKFGLRVPFWKEDWAWVHNCQFQWLNFFQKKKICYLVCTKYNWNDPFSALFTYFIGQKTKSCIICLCAIGSGNKSPVQIMTKMVKFGDFFPSKVWSSQISFPFSVFTFSKSASIFWTSSAFRQPRLNATSAESVATARLVRISGGQQADRTFQMAPQAARNVLVK